MTRTLPNPTGWKLALIVLGCAIALVLAIPVVAVAGLVGRLVLPAVILLGVALVLFVPAFRRRLLDPEPAGPETFRGLRLARDVTLLEGHGWSRRHRSGLTEIGADDLVARVLGPIDAVHMPVAGTHIARGATLFTVHGGERRIPVRAPASGVIVRVNTQLLAQPALAHEAPYDEGWIVMMRPDGPASASEEGRFGDMARAWFRREVDLVLAAVSSPSAVGVAMQDGGELTGDLRAAIDDATWERLRSERFGG